jgi:hypothetical protein
MIHKPMKTSHRLLGLLFVLWLVGVVTPKRERTAPTPKPAQVSIVEHKMAPGIEQCFEAGTNMARVFLSNFQSLSEAGVLASDMMEKGCEQQVGDKGDDCVHQCKTAFKVEAKVAVRSLGK